VSKNILLTGGTGFIGSNIAYRFLQRGDKVYFLIRPKEGIEPGKRIEDSIKVIDDNFHLGQYQYDILEGDITSPFCGIAKEKISQLNGNIDEFWHAAASFSFDELEAELTKRVNLGGTRNALDLASAIGSPPFHHLSTAYTAGDFEGIFFEADLNKGQEFRNPYEKTKYEAELLVNNYTDKFSIYRLSIVVGDSYNGRTLTFTGYYRFFRSFNLLRNIIISRIQRDKNTYLGSGIQLNDDNVLILPVIIPCDNSFTLNLIPVDWAVDTILLLASKKEASGKTFHVTHPRPPQNKWLVETSCRLLGIDGLRIEKSNGYANLMNNLDLICENPMMSSIQRKIHEGIKDYLPYIWREAQFDNSNVKQILSSVYTPPPPITEELLKTFLDYASRKKFRRKVNS